MNRKRENEQSCASRISFNAWLNSHLGQDTNFGHLAQAAADDPEWPAEPASYQQLREHLEETGGNLGALETTMHAWAIWLKDTGQAGLERDKRDLVICLQSKILRDAIDHGHHPLVIAEALIESLGGLGETYRQMLDIPSNKCLPPGGDEAILEIMQIARRRSYHILDFLDCLLSTTASVFFTLNHAYGDGNFGEGDMSLPSAEVESG